MAAATELGSAPSSRRMMRWRGATALFLTLSLADLFLTWFMLESLGGAEANPFAAQVLELFGWPGLALHKFGCVALVICLVAVIVKRRPRLARFVLRTGCLSALMVVGYSLWLLFMPQGLLCASEELTTGQRERDHLALLHREQDRCRAYSSSLVRRLARGDMKLADAAGGLQTFLRTCRYDPMRFLPGFYDELRGEACLAAHLVHGVGFEIASTPEALRRLASLKGEFARYGVPLPDLALSSFTADPEAFLKQRSAERALLMSEALPLSACRTGDLPHRQDQERYKTCR